MDDSLVYVYGQGGIACDDDNDDDDGSEWAGLCHHPLYINWRNVRHGAF